MSKRPERSDAHHGEDARMSGSMGDLPHALTNEKEVKRALADREPAVFLDYDGTLTPIVERPEDATISDSMREAVRELAGRCPVCVVSGRDRPVVQELMGLDDLIVAGSHGFDIWSPNEGTIQMEAGSGSAELLDAVRARLEDGAASIEGSLVEPKKTSVAIHYRLVSEDEKPGIKHLVDGLLEEYPDDLKVTPGKMVYEIQPKIDWDKGKAVLYLLEALELDREDVLPIYLGDDVTDEDAFQALSGGGLGIFVGYADDPEVAGRDTAADYVLNTVEEVERFLAALAR
jgi:trehalose 6-phosphate phosphatase